MDEALAAGETAQNHRMTEDEEDVFAGNNGLRRAVSEGTLLDRSAGGARVRSERVRRATQLFEGLTAASGAAERSQRRSLQTAASGAAAQTQRQSPQTAASGAAAQTQRQSPQTAASGTAERTQRQSLQTAASGAAERTQRQSPQTAGARQNTPRTVTGASPAGQKEEVVSAPASTGLTKTRCSLPSQRVDAIVALGSSSTPAEEDSFGDEATEEELWARICAKIGARRRLFRRMESNQNSDQHEPVQKANSKDTAVKWSPSVKTSPQITPAKKAKTTDTAAPVVASAKQQSSADPPQLLNVSGQLPQKTSPNKSKIPLPVNSEAAKTHLAKLASIYRDTTPEQKRLQSATANGAAISQLPNGINGTKADSQTPGEHADTPSKRETPAGSEQEATLTTPRTPPSHADDIRRGSPGKYIEQSEEQEVLRSLDSTVLPMHKLAVQRKVRERLLVTRAQAEWRQQKLRRQRDETAVKMQALGDDGTTDASTRRERLRSRVAELECGISEASATIEQAAREIADTDTSIRHLEGKVQHLATGA